MVAVTPSQLLSTWERVWAASPTEKAVGLLQAVHGDLSTHELLQAPVGIRDALLLQLRESLFGTQVPMLVTCPDCGQQIELELRTEQLRLQPQNSPDKGFLTEDIEGHRYRMRVPNSRDLLAIAVLSAPTQRVQQLLTRCVVEEHADGSTTPIAELSDTVVDALTEAMDAADPQANVEVPVKCVQCEHAWSALFDIVTYLWTELDTWAQRTLNEIHLLASTYGWSEPEILNLSAARRQLYLNMVRG